LCLNFFIIQNIEGRTAVIAEIVDKGLIVLFSSGDPSCSSMLSKLGSDKFIRLMLSILIIEDAYYNNYYYGEIRTPFSY
jgi:hypothetical protein